MHDQWRTENHDDEHNLGDTPPTEPQAAVGAATNGDADRFVAGAQDYGEPDALTLLGDVLQRPKQAFSYLAQPGTERVGPAIIVYLLSQIPLNWRSNAFGPDVPSTLARLLGNAAWALVGLAVAVAFLHLFARMLGGRNAYSKLFQATAIASLPSLLAAPFLAVGAGLGAFASSVTGIWSFVLSVIAVREVYRFSTGRALAAIAAPILLLIAIIVAVAVAAALLGLTSFPWQDFL